MTYSIESADNGVLVLLELVEHPGGRDGGEFPQRHHFHNKASADTLHYETGLPESPTDNFEEVRFAADSLEEAKQLLLLARAKAQATVDLCDQLLHTTKFEQYNLEDDNEG